MKSKRSSLDRISALPETIIEIILCLLSIKEAARTSILSREWRYKWTTISKVDIILPLSLIRPLSYISKEKQIDTGRTPFLDLLQVLLMHQGLIHEFSLYMNQFEVDNIIGFDQVVLHLSKNNKLKKLKLHGIYGLSRHNLPISIFSLHHLIELDIHCFNLDYQPIFNEFGSLRRLSLIDVGISTKTLLHLLSNCPLLKSLALSIRASHLGGENCTVIEFFKCLPMIEQLTTYGDVSKWLVLDSGPQKLSTLLFHLKYFCFQRTHFDGGYGYGLASLLVLIKCSPNLEKIEVDRLHTYEKYPIVWEEYSDFSLECLSELKIEHASNSKSEMEFIKFILSMSPKLKKVNLWGVYPRKKRFEMLQNYLWAPRASPNLCLNVPPASSRVLNFL